MKSICKIIAASAMVLSGAEAQSRTGKNVHFVYQISAQGSAFPSENLKLAKNAAEEATQLNSVTPLGIRQQYMIGNELRYRYQEESPELLAELYDITQIFIQSSWNDTSILSAQSMLLGIYPPGKNNYVLEKDQVANAVPPIENFDFQPWIDEMGLEALPHQTTIFPIQMNGWSYDYLLSLDNINCKQRGEASASIQAGLTTYANQQISNKGAPYTDFFSKHGSDWQKTCSYVSWAYIESVDLQDTVETATPLDSLYQLCQTIGKHAAQQIFTLVEGNTSGITSNDLRTNLNTRMVFWMEKVGQTTTAAQKKQLADHKLTTTTGSEDPRYVAFWTSEQQLQIFAQELSNDAQVAAMLPLPPSSTIIIEFAKLSTTSNDLTASLFINDQPVTMAQCSDALTCAVSTYQTAIAASVKFTNVTNECEQKYVPPVSQTHALRFD